MAGAQPAHRWLKSYPAGIDWAAPIAPKPLWRILDNAAVEFGPKPCVDFLDRQWTFEEIRDHFAFRTTNAVRLALARALRRLRAILDGQL